MRRLLLLAVFLAVGTGLLIWLAGGIEGPGARQSTPEIEAPFVASDEADDTLPIGNLPARVHALEETSIPAPPEPVRYVDAATGESVLIPDFLPWFLEFRKGTPAPSQRPGRQALEAQDVHVVTWRKPQTLDEARGLARMTEGIRDRMRKWDIVAPHAFVDGLGLTALDAKPGGPETEIEVDGGVKLVDVVREIVISSEALTLWPHQDRAQSTTSVVVRHETFELTGEGLTLKRDGAVTRIEIPRNAVLRLFGDVPGPDGKPLLDLGDDAFVPGHVASEGSAVLIHRTPERPGGNEQLTVELTRRVHAEQGVGRSLDAERVRVEAYRLQRPGQPENEGRWQIERFEADGGVVIEYAGTTDEKAPYLLSASCRHLLHEIAPDGSATTLLEGNPEFTLRGSIPMEGLGRSEGPGFLRASATEQALLQPALLADVPPDQAPEDYRRLILRGDAHLESREAGLDPIRDTLEGEQMTVLLREIEERTPDDKAKQRIVAVSFAMLGDVRLGGTRMSGMTHHLVATGLDSNAPILTAQGPGTSFAFHGLRRGERLLGGSRSDRPETSPSGSRAPAAADSPEPEPAWTLERLVARENVVVETSVGGAALGLPARLEGDELVYDSISDRARVKAAKGGDVLLTVGTLGPEHNELRARSMQLDRGRGEIEADGRVRGIVYVRTGTQAASGLAMPEQAPGQPAALGVATNGRIEIRTQVTMDPWAPRAGSAQVLTIEGDLVAELTAATLEVDSLRARYLQVTLVHTLPSPRDAPGTAAPTARIAMGDRTGTRTRPIGSPDTARHEPTAPPQRWDLEAGRLRARFGSSGFEALEASTSVRLESKDGEVRGDVFTYDAVRRRLRVTGSPTERAKASFGPENDRNEVYARELEVQLGDSGPEHLWARRPVLATLLRRDPQVPGAVERFVVAPTGDVEMTTTALTTEGLVEIRRRVRKGAGEPWEAPFRLWANRLVVKGRNLLAAKAADVQTVVATGPDTTLRAGAGDEMTTVWGERIELDVATSLATLEGAPNKSLRILRGRVEDPRADSEQSRIVIDLNTNTIHDWQHPRVILRGARDVR